MNNHQLALMYASQSRQLLFQRNLDNLVWANSQRQMALSYQIDPEQARTQLLQAEVLRSQGQRIQ